MKIETRKFTRVQVEAKVLHIRAKCSDCCIARLEDAEGKTLAENHGYVPEFMPDGGGDYVTLSIDLDTGRILNWQPPAAEDVETWIEEATGPDSE